MNSLFGELNICGFMAGMSNDGDESMGITGGEPINGDMPNEPFPDCPEPFYDKKKKLLASAYRRYV